MKFRKNRKTGKLSVTFALLLFAYSAMAQYSETKDIRKEFKTSKNSVVEIVNKYGDISIETWEKDSIVVEIHVEVSDKSLDKVQDKISSINFDLTQSANYIVIATLIGDNKNLLMSEFKKLKENIGVSDSQVKIDMKLKMPDNLSLKIDNKFGNVYLDDYNGEIKLDMSNGKLKAQYLSGYTSIKISFGDAIIHSMDSGTLEVYYGELNLTSARKLRMTTKTSDITITEIEQLTLNSTRDDYRIRIVDDFVTEANWTDFSISEFRRKSEIKMNYGDLTIDKIMPTIENLFIDARSTKINLIMASDTKINFDITSSKEVNLPMDAIIDSKENIAGEDKTTRIIGRTGKIAKDDPKLIVKTKSGDVTIMNR